MKWNVFRCLECGAEVESPIIGGLQAIAPGRTVTIQHHANGGHTVVSHPIDDSPRPVPAIWDAREKR